MSHAITYDLDDEQQSTNEKDLTAAQILEAAGLDPANYYLEEIRGSKKISYKDNPSEMIKLHQNMKFFSVPIESTTVS